MNQDEIEKQLQEHLKQLELVEQNFLNGLKLIQEQKDKINGYLAS